MHFITMNLLLIERKICLNTSMLPCKINFLTCNDSLFVFLFLAAPPHVVSTDLTDRTIFETQNAKFEVKATGLPRPDVKWLKDGKTLRSGDRVRLTTSGELYLMDLSKAILEDEGLYMCVLTNKLGEEIVEGYLTIGTVDELRKPRFTEPLNDFDVALKANGEFKAVFTADPVPDITWYIFIYIYL